jgi:hypothetical protein
MKSSHLILLFIGGGLALMTAGLTGLKAEKDGLSHHQNPFAIRKSGFGKMVARLSQNTIDIVWHLGIEQVNPMDHVHGHEDDHGDHHEEGHGDEPENHADDHKEVQPSGQALAVTEKQENHAEHGEPGHVHDEHCKHDTDETKKPGSREGWLAESKEWMHALGLRRYDRTNPKAVSKAHQAVIAQDISDLFYRGYMMDPTDYGVYNGFFLFLTTGEYGGTDATRKHARLVSDNTIGEALRETTDPQAWVTAAMAQLNLFFLDQDEFRLKEQSMPAASLTEHKQKMEYLIQQAGVLIEKAKSEGRWEAIAEDRRNAMDERIKLAQKSSAQFEKLLELAQKGVKPVERGGAPTAPVADKGESADSGALVP